MLLESILQNEPLCFGLQAAATGAHLQNSV